MSTTTIPAPVTPPPDVGSTPHVEDPDTAQPESRWSKGLRWASDATSIVLLIAVLWWLAYHDGGWERAALAKVGLLAVIAVPAAVAELRRMSTVVRVLIAMWGLGLVASLLFAAERSGFAQPAITYALVPVVGLVTYRIWRRRWGPPAVAGLLLVSFGLYWYQSFMDWWGLAMLEGRQPTWRPLSWHNQSGTLMVAFALLFGGAALTGRKVVAAGVGLASAAAFAGAWLSGSRGTIVVLVLGLIILAAVAVAVRGWTAGVWRTGMLVVVSAAIVAGLLGFAEMEGGTGEIGQPVAARTESAEGNFFRRFLHIDAAIGMFMARPVTGQGLGSYRNLSPPFMSPNSNLTASAHNEYAQVLGEGGLALALPFLGLAAVAGVAVWRRSRSVRLGFTELAEDIEVDDLRWPLSLGAVAAVAALLVHQGADFDWGYPVIPALLGIAVAIAGHDSKGGTARGPRGSTIITVITGIVLSTLLIAGSVGGLWQNRSYQRQDGLSAAQLARVPVAWDAERASNAAFWLMGSGEYEEARWTLQRAVSWNPGFYPVRVDLAIVDYTTGDISGRELVDVLLSGYLDFASSNEAAQALLDGGEHALARSILESLLQIYPRYETWGIDINRADTWYLLVRAAAEGEGCESARAVAASARQADGMDAPDELEPIDQLVDTTCQ